MIITINDLSQAVKEDEGQALADSETIKAGWFPPSRGRGILWVLAAAILIISMPNLKGKRKKNHARK